MFGEIWNFGDDIGVHYVMLYSLIFWCQNCKIGWKVNFVEKPILASDNFI